MSHLTGVSRPSFPYRIPAKAQTDLPEEGCYDCLHETVECRKGVEVIHVTGGVKGVNYYRPTFVPCGK